MNSVHCSRCVCVCVCVCVCLHGSMGWVKYREHISQLFILSIIVYVTNNKKKKTYPIMVKCLNIGKNIGKPI